MQIEQDADGSPCAATTQRAREALRGHRTARDRGAHPLPTDPARYSRSNDAAHAMGSVIKVQCVYPTPFWRDAGLAGQATSDTGPVRITFDNTPPDAVSA